MGPRVTLYVYYRDHTPLTLPHPSRESLSLEPWIFKASPGGPLPDYDEWTVGGLKSNVRIIVVSVRYYVVFVLELVRQVITNLNPDKQRLTRKKTFF